MLSDHPTDLTNRVVFFKLQGSFKRFSIWKSDKKNISHSESAFEVDLTPVWWKGSDSKSDPWGHHSLNCPKSSHGGAVSGEVFRSGIVSALCSTKHHPTPLQHGPGVRSRQVLGRMRGRGRAVAHENSSSRPGCCFNLNKIQEAGQKHACEPTLVTAIVISWSAFSMLWRLEIHYGWKIPVKAPFRMLNGLMSKTPWIPRYRLKPSIWSCQNLMAAFPHKIVCAKLGLLRVLGISRWIPTAFAAISFLQPLSVAPQSKNWPQTHVCAFYKAWLFVADLELLFCKFVHVLLLKSQT